MHGGEDTVRRTRRSARKQPAADAAILNEIQLQEPIQITDQGRQCVLSNIVRMWLHDMGDIHPLCF